MRRTTWPSLSPVCCPVKAVGLVEDAAAVVVAASRLRLPPQCPRLPHGQTNRRALVLVLVLVLALALVLVLVLALALALMPVVGHQLDPQAAAASLPWLPLPMKASWRM